jgi:hypothetical protein
MLSGIVILTFLSIEIEPIDDETKFLNGTLVDILNCDS